MKNSSVFILVCVLLSAVTFPLVGKAQTPDNLPITPILPPTRSFELPEEFAEQVERYGTSIGVINCASVAKNLPATLTLPDKPAAAWACGVDAVNSTVGAIDDIMISASHVGIRAFKDLAKAQEGLRDAIVTATTDSANPGYKELSELLPLGVVLVVHKNNPNWEGSFQNSGSEVVIHKVVGKCLLSARGSTRVGVDVLGYIHSETEAELAESADVEYLGDHRGFDHARFDEVVVATNKILQQTSGAAAEECGESAVEEVDQNSGSVFRERWETIGRFIREILGSVPLPQTEDVNTEEDVRQCIADCAQYGRTLSRICQDNMPTLDWLGEFDRAGSAFLACENNAYYRLVSCQNTQCDFYNYIRGYKNLESGGSQVLLEEPPEVESVAQTTAEGEGGALVDTTPTEQDLVVSEPISSSEDGEEYTAVVTDITGVTLMLLPDGSSVDITEAGTKIPPGAQLFTSFASEVTLLFTKDSFAEAVVHMNSLSELHIDNPYQEDPGVFERKLKFGGGTMRFRVHEGDFRTDWQVSTPNGTASPAGTDFGVAYDLETNTSVFEMYDGLIEVVATNSGVTKVISSSYGKPIKRLTVAADGSVTERIAIPKDERKGSAMDGSNFSLWVIVLIIVSGLGFLAVRNSEKIKSLFPGEPKTKI